MLSVIAQPPGAGQELKGRSELLCTGELDGEIIFAKKEMRIEKDIWYLNDLRRKSFGQSWESHTFFFRQWQTKDNAQRFLSFASCWFRNHLGS